MEQGISYQEQISVAKGKCNTRGEEVAVAGDYVAEQLSTVGNKPDEVRAMLNSLWNGNE